MNTTVYLVLLEMHHEGAVPVGVYSSHELAMDGAERDHKKQDDEALTWDDTQSIAHTDSGTRYHIYLMNLNKQYSIYFTDAEDRFF